MKYTYSTENSNQNKEKKSNKWIYAIILLIILGIGLFLVYWFLIKNDKSEDFIVTTAHQNYASLEYEKEGNIINLKATPKYNVEFYGWRYGENGEIFSTALETSVKFEKQNDTVVYYADFRPINDTHFEYDKDLENGTATITVYDFNSKDIIFPSYFTDQWDFYAVTSISADFSETDITSVVFPEELYTINQSQFSSCKSLKSVSILGKTEIIDSYAFSSSDSITNLTLNEGLKKIYQFAFDSIQLTELYLPSTVDFISSTAFQNSNSLEKITVSDNNPNFKDCDSNVIIDVKNNSLILGCKNSIIPEDVVEISDYAFYKCLGLKSITIPNSVKVLGLASFAETGLNEINLNHVSEIKSSAFLGCKDLTTVKFSSLTMLSSIGDFSFNNTGLTSFTVPKTVISIGMSCFTNSLNLKTLNFEEGSNLKTIYEGAFSNSGITSLYIPSSVTLIDGNITHSCDNLKILQVDDDNKIYNDCDGKNVIVEIATKKLISTCNNSILGDEIEIIGEKSLSYLMFDSIYIPKSVTKIENNSFWGSLISYIYFENEVPPVIESETFKNIKNLNIFVKSDYIDKYKKAEIWSDYANNIYSWEASQFNVKNLNSISINKDEETNLVVFNKRIEYIRLSLNAQVCNSEGIRIPEFSANIALTFSYNDGQKVVDPTEEDFLQVTGGEIVEIDGKKYIKPNVNLNYIDEAYWNIKSLKAGDITIDVVYIVENNDGVLELFKNGDEPVQYSINLNIIDNNPATKQ